MTKFDIGRSKSALSENSHNRRCHRERGKDDSHHTRSPRESVQAW